MNNIQIVVAGALGTIFSSTALLSDPKGPTVMVPRVAVGGTAPVGPAFLPVLRHEAAADHDLGDSDEPKSAPAIGILIASLLSIPIWGALVVAFRLWFGG